jgi:chromosomal replication initiator protein
MQHDTLWNEAVAFTRAKSPASFEQWFSGIQFDGMTDGVVSLRARDEFVREWVDQHFLPTLVDHLRSQTGLSIQIAWCVGGELDRPVALGNGQPALPVRPRALMPDRPITQRPANGVEADLYADARSAPASQRMNGGFANGGAANGGFANGGAANGGYANGGYANGGYANGGYANGGYANGGSNGYASSGGKNADRPAAPIEGLNPKYTFGNFVVGPSNQLAHAASIAAAGGGGPRHNPLFLCGGTGLGKTHLVHAVAHRFRTERPSSRILYVSAEKFVNEFVQSLQEGRMNEFRARYRERCDLLLVDDIQFLASKTQTQEEFFHAFNALHQADKQIIVTSDKYPQQLEKMEERLVSRFSWGLVADIQGPELETRVAILRKKAQLEEIELADEVVLFLAQAIRSNVRELEGTLIRLAAKSSLLGRQIDLEFARQELALTSNPRASEAGVDDIQRVVCHHFKLRTSDLVSKDRHKSIAFARHVAMYLCKQRLKCSFPELGRAFGNRDHTTVMSAVRKVEALRTSDPEVRAHLEALERKLGTTAD